MCCCFLAIFSDLGLDLWSEIRGNEPFRVLVTHEPGKEFLVLLHPVDEEAFQGLIDDNAEVIHGLAGVA